ncbi:MAG: polysulfide reductase NrfD [Candidatus Dormibacteraeota bacterium]|nr:polysulfide reductase NrfD [Candidatus Dormibacteraeota bacterium]
MTTPVSRQGYYDYPVVKRPVWTWEVPVYFWLGGIGSGAFIITSLVQRFGSRDDARSTADGFYLAAAALLPCTPLLIKDLGRPDRFHHMLRVFKPLSPMNLGAWTLAALTPVALIRAGVRAADEGRLPSLAQGLVTLVPRPLVELAGSMLGLVLAGYTGVLLAATNVPLWARSKLLGGLFTASAFSSGSASLSLVAACRGGSGATLYRLGLVETAASAAELGLLAGYVAQSGGAARALTSRRLAAPFWLGAVAAGMALPLLLHRLAGRRPGRRSRALATVASLAAVGGSLALRWSIFEAGKDSSDDQAASFALSS